MYKYPYGDSQQLNLDWIISKIKELEASGASGGADLEEVSNALLSLTYNTSTAYRRYDYAFLNGKLYRCLTDTSGVFNPTAWQEALIGDDLAVLTRWINAIDAAAVVDVKFDTTGTNGKIQQKYHDEYHDVVEVDYTPVQNSKRPLSSNAGYELNGAITHEYVVDVNGTGDYTSLTACFLALKNDKQKKIIRVKCGDYNIYNEYVAANVPIYTGSSPSTEYYDYNVWIPDNTHLIGEGVVRLLWQPTSSQVTQKQSATVSPLNIGNNCCIENVEIYCKNGRYCIHDDPYKPSDTSIASAAKGSIHKLINVRCYKQANDGSLGSSNIVGIGIHNSIQYLYDNCLFNSEINDSAFYAHTNFNDAGTSLEAENSNIFVFNNCRFENNGGACVSLRNTPTYIRIKELAVFNNCWFKNQIDLIDNAPITPHNANAWQLVLNGCNETTINIDDANNTYTPIIVNATPVKSDFEWGTLSSNTSGGSVYAQKFGDIILLNGSVVLDGSVAGASALVATFSDIKPISTTTIYAYGTYNNASGIYTLRFNYNGEITTYTGGGTFTGSITFFNSVLFL